jgi:hypothetical protein
VLFFPRLDLLLDIDLQATVIYCCLTNLQKGQMAACLAAAGAAAPAAAASTACACDAGFAPDCCCICRIYCWSCVTVLVLSLQTLRILTSTSSRRSGHGPLELKCPMACWLSSDTERRTRLALRRIGSDFLELDILTRGWLTP